MSGNLQGYSIAGIGVVVDASGAVQGAAMAERALGGMENKAYQVREAVGRAGASMGQALMEAAALGISGGMLMGMGRSIENNLIKPMNEAYKSFELTMHGVQVAGEFTEQQMAGIGDRIIQLGRQSGKGPQEAAAGYENLIKTGYGVEEAFIAVKDAMDLSTASGNIISIADASKSGTAAMMKFRSSGESVRTMFDQFSRAANKTMFDIEEFPVFINGIRDAAQKMNAPFSEVASLFGVLRQSGKQSAEAAQSISMFSNTFLNKFRAIQSFAKREKLSIEDLMLLPEDTKTRNRIVNSFKTLGVNIFDAHNKIKSPIKLITDLSEAYEKLMQSKDDVAKVDVGQLLGAEGTALLDSVRGFKYTDIAGTVWRGVDALKAMNSEVKTGITTLDTYVESMNSSIAGQLALAKSGKEAINIFMGKLISGPEKVFIAILGVVLDKVLLLIEKFPVLAQFLGYAVIAFSALSQVVGIALIAMAGLVTWQFIVIPQLATIAAQGALAAGGMAAFSTAMAGASIAAKFLAANMWKVSVAALRFILPAILAGVIIFTLWKKIWDKDASGMFKTIQMRLKNLWLYITAFSSGFIRGIEAGINILVIFAEAVGKAIIFVMDKVDDLLKFLGIIPDAEEDAKKFADVWRDIGKVIGVVAVASLTIWTASLTKAIAMMGVDFVVAVGKMSQALLGLGAASNLAFGVWGILILAGIGFIAYAIYQIYDAWALFVDFFTTTQGLRDTANFFTLLWWDLRDALGEMALAVGGFLNTVFGAIADGIVSIVFTAIDLIVWGLKQLGRVNPALGIAVQGGEIATSGIAGYLSGKTSSLGRSIMNSAQTVFGSTYGQPPGTTAPSDNVQPAGGAVPYTGGSSSTTSQSSSRSSTIKIDKINVTAQNSTPEEAAKMARQIFEKLQPYLDGLKEISF